MAPELGHSSHRLPLRRGLAIVVAWRPGQRQADWSTPGAPAAVIRAELSRAGESSDRLPGLPGCHDHT